MCLRRPNLRAAKTALFRKLGLALLRYRVGVVLTWHIQCPNVQIEAFQMGVQ